MKSSKEKEEKTAGQETKAMLRRVKPYVIILCLAGMILLLYPTVSALWNRYRGSRIITGYRELTDTGSYDYEAELQAAVQYNREPGGEGYSVINSMQYETSEKYESLLNISGNGTMGYIDIPKIAVQLPIYHYYTEEQTEGAGHIYGSSLPVGGAGTHCVLAAHRGLPSAKLFTDLDELEIGDTFYIHVLGETHAYMVDDIQTVLPEEVSQVQIDEDKDYVTLVTCTPYAVNTHRLLVRGVRTEYNGENTETTIMNQIRHQVNVYQWLGLTVLLLLLIIITAGTRKGRKHEHQKEIDNVADSQHTDI